MLVSIFLNEGEIGEKAKAVLFGITIIPLLLNPVVTFALRVDCRDESLKYWRHFKKYFTPKKIKKTSGRRAIYSVSANQGFIGGGGVILEVG